MTLPIAPFYVLSASQVAALLLVILLLGASYVAWAVLLLRGQATGKFRFERSEEARTDWLRLPELTVVGLTLMLTCLHLVPKSKATTDKPVVLEQVELQPTESVASEKHEPASEEPPGLTPWRLISHIAFTGGLTVVLAAFLIGSGRSPAAYGFKLESIAQQVGDGVFGYLLSLLPMAAMMLATAVYRTKETRNSLLTLLAETSDPRIIVLIAAAAVVVAPLYEELMFRVVLQGWLCSLLKPVVAIPLVAVIFGAIHGLPDGVALLPLALVLGFVFDRRHSYLSVVVIHALFNATMLTLALLGQG